MLTARSHRCCNGFRLRIRSVGKKEAEQGSVTNGAVLAVGLDPAWADFPKLPNLTPG
jgi:hypothetical protein